MKAKFLIVLLALLFSSVHFQMNNLLAQEVQAGFAMSISGESNDHGNGISADNLGNSFVTGHFYGNIVLGDSLYTTLGNQDAYLAKLDAQGEVVWALTFGGTGADEGLAVAADADGNCYATGFIGSMDVEIRDQTISSMGGYDVYVLKFSPSGDLIWAQTFGSTTNDMGRAIAISAEGIVHLSGSFQSMMTVGSEVLVSTASIDAFACQIDPQGNVLWARQISGPNQVEARGIAADHLGNTYVSGDFLGDSVTAGALTEEGFGSYDTFLVKYDSDGEVLNLRAFGAEGADSGVTLSTDLVGNLFLAGYFEGSFQIDGVSLNSNGNRDMMVVKFGVNGDALWAQSVGNTGNDIAYAIDTDAAGNCYFTGLFFSTVNLGNFELSGGGTLVAKLNPQGAYDWAIRFADANVDNGGRGISVDDDGAARVVGNFFASFELGGLPVEGSQGRDVYVVLIEDVVYLSIDAGIAEHSVKVFPNPARNIVQVEGIEPNTFCEIIDMHGRLVCRTRSAANRISIDLSSLPPSLYLLRTEHKGELKITKLLLAQ